MLHHRGILIIAKIRGVIKTEFPMKMSFKLMDNLFFPCAIKILELLKVTISRWEISWWRGGMGLGYKK